MRYIAFLAVLLSLAAPAFASDIRDDENIVFFPTAARQEGHEWVIPVHAWVFEPEEGAYVRGAAISAFADALELEGAEQNEVFRTRARWFLVDNEGGKSFKTTMSSRVFGPSGPNGHIEGETRMMLPEDIKPVATDVTFTAVLPDGDARIFAGRAVLVGEEGVSVISDIDDTIKISEVTDKKKLMEHTFLKPFEAAPGMVEAYKRLADAGAAFHYVSSSPWQLYPALGEFMAQAKYPAGSVHLRIFRVKDDSVLNMLKSSEETKPPVINKLLKDYPKRQFVMIGDSGEKDPEIYGKIARENPGRVKHIYIRRVTGDTADSPRYAQAFDGLPSGSWTVFDDAEVIK